MASGLTPLYLLPYPLATDPVDVHGDVYDLADRLDNVLGTFVSTSFTNTFTVPQIFSVNSADAAVRITQVGAGEAFRVEDEANPDSSPFVITASGNVGIGKSPSGSMIDVQNNDAANVGLIINGATSQTGDFTQWKNSLGSTLAKINSAGSATFQDLTINGTSITAPTLLLVIDQASGNFIFNPDTLSGSYAITGFYNISLGWKSLKLNTSGSENVALGIETLKNNTTGSYNVAINSYALSSNTTGISNFALGISTLSSNTTGSQNIAIGNSSSILNSTGSHNIAIGNSAAGNSVSVSEIIAIGREALTLNLGIRNTAVGMYAGRQITTGTENTLFGDNAGRSGTNDLTTGSNNIIIGYNAAASAATVSNEITLGNSSISAFRLPGLGLRFTSNSTLESQSTSIATFIIKSALSQTSNLTEWQTSTGTVIASISATGAFSAVTKSFDIEHPTKENMRLRYTSLEGPENGVYVRGKSKDKIISLPDYWTGLVHDDSITVQLTAIGSGTVYVDFIANNAVKVGGTAEEFYYFIQAERKDIDKLIVEY